MFDLLRVSKKALAFASLANSSKKSSGRVEVLGASYALSHRPSSFAASICSSPAGFILPASISRSTRSLLTLDHTLLARRGVNFCNHDSSLYDFDCPSIHPQHNASSTASAYVIDFLPEPFLKNCSQTPSELA